MPWPWSDILSHIQPGVPNLSVLELTETSVTLVWTNVGAIGYEIKDCNPLQSMLDCRGARAWEHTPNNSPRAFYTKTLEDLERGREYTFRIRSRSGAEFSDWSESLEVTPGMPFRVSVKAEMSYDAGGAPEVRLTWDAVKHAAGYEVIRGDGRHIDYTETVSELNFTDRFTHRFGRSPSAYKESRDYYYAVRGTNDVSKGPWTTMRCNMQELEGCELMPHDDGFR